VAGPVDSGRALVSVDAPPPVAGLDASAFDVRLLRSLEVLTGALAWVEEHHRDVPIA
jgi:hypothetical protein